MLHQTLLVLVSVR